MHPATPVTTQAGRCSSPPLFQPAAAESVIVLRSSCKVLLCNRCVRACVRTCPLHWPTVVLRINKRNKTVHARRNYSHQEEISKSLILCKFIDDFYEEKWPGYNYKYGFDDSIQAACHGIGAASRVPDERAVLNGKYGVPCVYYARPVGLGAGCARRGKTLKKKMQCFDK